ncbi:Hypothetical predicted protein, partial [Paramuricea clavata]
MVRLVDLMIERAGNFSWFLYKNWKSDKRAKQANAEAQKKFKEAREKIRQAKLVEEAKILLKLMTFWMQHCWCIRIAENAKKKALEQYDFRVTHNAKKTRQLRFGRSQKIDSHSKQISITTH